MYDVAGRVDCFLCGGSMIGIIRIVLVIVAIVSVLIVYSCCVVAGRVDQATQQMEILKKKDKE